MFQVAALYRFAPFDDPAGLRQPLLDLCAAEGVMGTLLLAREGVNGTIAGTDAGIAAVLDHIRGLPDCADLDVKYSTAADMLTYLEANTGRPKNRIERAMKMAHQPRADFAKDRKVGLTWQIREGDGPTLLYHNGGTGGFSTVIAFNPDTGAGVVILANSASFWRREDIAVRLLEGNVAGFPGFDPSRESTGP